MKKILTLFSILILSGSAFAGANNQLNRTQQFLVEEGFHLFETLSPVGSENTNAVAAVENIYQNAKVGDFAAYQVQMEIGVVKVDGVFTHKVKAKTATEITISSSFKSDQGEVPAEDKKIDLTEANDPLKLPEGKDITVSDVKNGKEKLKLAGTEYETSWISYKAKGKVEGKNFESQAKTWVTPKGVLGGMVKADTNMKIDGSAIKMKMELTKAGNQ